MAEKTGKLTMAVIQNLIYDVGMHNGNDTHFYLSKGYKVLAIEANPVLVEHAKMRFNKEIKEGRLHILNVGIESYNGYGGVFNQVCQG